MKMHALSFVSVVSFAAFTVAGVPQRTTLVPMGNVRVGFTIETGEWKPSKNAKSAAESGLTARSSTPRSSRTDR